jgi:hypothetical protein
VKLSLQLAAEARKGSQFFFGIPGEKLSRLMLTAIEPATLTSWNYLVQRPHPWKKQLFVKGRKLPASAVWSTMKVNNMTVAEAAENWDLPGSAINEIVEYCDSNRALLEMEAEEDANRLQQKGIHIEPKAARR